MNSVSQDEVEVVARATARVFLAQERAWMDLEDRRLAALAEADRIATEQDNIVKRVQGCYETAGLFGFDLLDVVGSIEAKPAVRPVQLVSAPAILKPPTVKEFILKAAQDAWPKRVRASELRQQMNEKFGWQLHEKTAGMTLYRLLKEGRLTRTGKDWFWNPSGAASEADFDPPEEADPPDTAWLHEVAG